jgi:hypothetical protein
MKVGYATALLFFVATPALSSSTKTVNKVTFECMVTGSDKDGFDLTAQNDGDSEMDCSASCQLTTNDKKTKTKDYKYPNSGTKTVRKMSGHQSFGGEAGLSGKPLTDPNVTYASCTAKPAQPSSR